MLQKILAITRKELYLTYSDRNAIVVLIATPLVLASIIAAAFGGIATTGISNIPVAIVNLDEGIEGSFNNGSLFVSAFVPPAEGESSESTVDTSDCPAATTSDGQNITLYDLTDAVQLSSAEEARAGVNTGTYAAAIIIPPDLTQRITYSQEQREIQPVAVEVYADPGRAVSAGIIRSITESIAAQLTTGNVTAAATIETMIERAQSRPAFGLQFAAAADSFEPDFGCAFAGITPISIDRQTVEGGQTEWNPLVFFGAGQAIFFMLFTAQAGANSILEERRNGTLTRQISTPTPQIVLLLGKLVGTFVTCVVQLLILFVAFTLVSTLFTGEFTFIWGTNFLAVLLVICASALAASGLGTFLSSLSRTPEAGNVIGSLIILVMGALGGTFFAVSGSPILSVLSRFTINYWGVDAFTKLAANQSDIALNLLVLGVIGGILFAVGTYIFHRRLKV